jgi:Phage portal protein, SPP1 Gp6-like
MSNAIEPITPTTLDPSLLDLLIDEHQASTEPRLRKLWAYYRNTAGAGGAGQDDRLAQTEGLPARLTSSYESGRATQQPGREVVIENDIAWRINTIVSFMFGKPLTIQSTANDPARADLIQRFLRRVFKNNGGARFFQDMGLLGSIYGYVDVLVRVSDSRPDPTTENPEEAGRFVLETVEAPRAIPLLSPQDYRQLDAYALHQRRRIPQVEQNHFLSRVRNRVLGGSGRRRRSVVEHTQVWTAETYQQFSARPGALGGGRKLIAEDVNRLGRIPVVHIQNLSQPYYYEGLSEVEPMVPLQNELNTRLSDRANRVTFQSFKMYLGKGIESFTERPVGPGQMWSTDNPDASITEFGGDGNSPSEDAHIAEVREAMDKSSTVSPLAAGLLHAKVGNLTSENALRIVMMGLLAKIDKKRLTYGHGIERVCELLLHAADVHGVLPNRPEERGVRLDWAEPLPDTDSQLLRNALMKIEVGVPRRQVLTELGYDDGSEPSHTDVLAS